MINVVPNAQLKVNFWWSANSTSDNPTSTKVEAVNGLNGKPVVIWPKIAALPISIALIP